MESGTCRFPEMRSAESSVLKISVLQTVPQLNHILPCLSKRTERYRPEDENNVSGRSCWSLAEQLKGRFKPSLATRALLRNNIARVCNYGLWFVVE